MPDPSNPLALLLAAVGAVAAVVGLLFKAYEGRTREWGAEKDARVTWLEARLGLADERETAWRDEARASARLVDRQLETLRDALAELHRLRTRA